MVSWVTVGRIATSVCLFQHQKNDKTKPFMILNSPNAPEDEKETGKASNKPVALRYLPDSHESVRVELSHSLLASECVEGTTSLGNSTPPRTVRFNQFFFRWSNNCRR